MVVKKYIEYENKNYSKIIDIVYDIINNIDDITGLKEHFGQPLITMQISYSNTKVYYVYLYGLDENDNIIYSYIIISLNIIDNHVYEKYIKVNNREIKTDINKLILNIIRRELKYTIINKIIFNNDNIKILFNDKYVCTQLSNKYYNIEPLLLRVGIKINLI